ncbi:universal stress protein [Amycolatopsis alkalitolerans]|uniref:Universal stress protein n=1 Tax=Amycolatopsis alkalitolerans TaxID=2547244 RepID=A0A5C4LXU6_9PSEU|nr:universal stress protein [Amycolatopsis alkalitolerans]
MNGYTVVAGVDGSASALHAVRWAAREAARRAAPVLVLHTAFVPEPEPYSPVRLPRSYGDAVLEQGEQWLAEAAKAAHEAAPEVTVRTEQRVGLAADHLVRASERAGLIVVGSRGLGGVAGMVLGSVAAAVAAHGHCPVVVVRGRTPEQAPPDSGPVVVGTDGSPGSDAAVAFAMQMAAERGVPVVAVYVAHRSGVTLPAEVQRQLDAVTARYPGVEVREQIVQDRPARGIVAAAEGAQLIVVGSRGRGGFAGLAFGSTSGGVLRQAPCPVAIARN